MSDSVPPGPLASPKPTSRLARVFGTKLTPGVAVLFFVALAVMCAVAAGIGYVSGNLRHMEVRR